MILLIAVRRYILKPWVMCADKGFNPFVQKKIEDIVPCRLRMKVASCYIVVYVSNARSLSRGDIWTVFDGKENQSGG